MSDLDNKLEKAMMLLIEALDLKESRYEQSCCADEIFELVYEQEDVVIRYEDGEIHFLGIVSNYGDGRKNH